MKDVTVGKIRALTERELSYIAGFLDGDGSVMALVEKHSEKKFGIRIRALVEFTQHDDNILVLKYLQKKIGSGHINRSLRNVWKYAIRDQSAVRDLLTRLSDHVVLKKPQIKHALTILKMDLSSRSSLIRASILCDKVSSSNLRSKSRRINGAKIVREMISRND